MSCGAPKRARTKSPRETARSHAAGERRVGRARQRGRGEHHVAHVDGRPVVHGALGDQRDQRDAAQRPQRGRAPPVRRRCLRMRLVMRHVRQHRGHRDQQHGRARRRRQRKVHGGRHAVREQRAASRRARHPADAEHAVQRRHDRPPERLLDRARFGVHRDVERRHAKAEHGEHDEQQPVVRRDQDQRAARGHRDAAREAGGARAGARDPRTGGQHRENRAARHGEQRERQHAGAQREFVAHGRNVHAPRRVDHPRDEEDGHRRVAGALPRGGRQPAMRGERSVVVEGTGSGC